MFRLATLAGNIRQFHAFSVSIPCKEISMHVLDAARPLAAAPPDDGEIWILIVDDEAGNRHTLQDVLQEQGYRVETAATGQEGLERARTRFFHAAILDIRLPDINGTELLARLKEAQSDTVAIMVTGYASLQTAIRAVDVGAARYLLKPLDIGQLCAALEQALAAQQQAFADRRRLSQCQDRIQELERREAQLTAQVRRLEQQLAAR
jgi:DNA-binding NtrC family response regulator